MQKAQHLVLLAAICAVIPVISFFRLDVPQLGLSKEARLFFDIPYMPHIIAFGCAYGVTYSVTASLVSVLVVEFLLKTDDDATK